MPEQAIDVVCNYINTTQNPANSTPQHLISLFRMLDSAQFPLSRFRFHARSSLGSGSGTVKSCLPYNLEILTCFSATLTNLEFNNQIFASPSMANSSFPGRAKRKRTSQSGLVRISLKPLMQLNKLRQLSLRSCSYVDEEELFLLLASLSGSLEVVNIERCLNGNLDIMQISREHLMRLCGNKGLVNTVLREISVINAVIYDYDIDAFVGEHLKAVRVFKCIGCRRASTLYECHLQEDTCLTSST